MTVAPETSTVKRALSAHAAIGLLGEDYYSACLARGDCFMGAERNVFGTLSYNF